MARTIYRKATIDDVEGIVKLCNECFDEKTPVSYAMNVFRQTMDDSKHYYLVGQLEDGQIIAHAKVTVIPTMYKKMNTYCILNHVCVKPEYRRHGAGTRLLRQCEKVAKEMGCVTMELWSNNFRLPAHACYKKYGFQIDDASFFSKKID